LPGLQQRRYHPFEFVANFGRRPHHLIAIAEYLSKEHLRNSVFGGSSDSSTACVHKGGLLLHCEHAIIDQFVDDLGAAPPGQHVIECGFRAFCLDGRSQVFRSLGRESPSISGCTFSLSQRSGADLVQIGNRALRTRQALGEHLTNENGLLHLSNRLRIDPKLGSTVNKGLPICPCALGILLVDSRQQHGPVISAKYIPVRIKNGGTIDRIRRVVH